MSKVSILIPARQEIYLQQTIDDLLAKAAGEIEIIVVLDGYWPVPPVRDDKRVILAHRKRLGMRESINGAASIATGKFLMKLDAHCIVAPGFDAALQDDCDKDWVVVPRRYSLDDDTWTVRTHRPFVDYEYLGWPHSRHLMKPDRNRLCAWVWDERNLERCNVLLDENMTFQGSCWFVHKEFFERRIGRMDSEGYGTFLGEAQEIGLKTWLGGGKVMTNKKTWYAHLWKGEPYREKYKALYGQQYTRLGFSEMKAGNAFIVDYWLNNRWAGRKRELEWLIERFWPVPSWPQDRSKWNPSNT